MVKRFNLYKEIHELIKDMIRYKAGKKKVPGWEINKTRCFWLHFFGFNSQSSMTIEELENFKIFLKSKVDSDFNAKAFPIFHVRRNT